MSGINLTKQQDDFALIINNTFLAVFDNLRSLTKSQSDLLCTTATKGCSPKRKLYTTANLVLLELHAPLALNGIHDFVKESDLASRCLHVKLKSMPDNQRKPETELKSELNNLMPNIFGALLNLTSKALAQLDNVTITNSARMMDFTKQDWRIRVGLENAARKTSKNLSAKC